MDVLRLIEVVIVVLFTSVGQLLMRFGMLGNETVRESVNKLILHILKTPILWLAIALYGFSTLLWLRVLSRYPVSSVYPMVSLGYVLVTFGGILFFGERLSLQGWVAVAVICGGTILLAFSAPAPAPN